MIHDSILDTIGRTPVVRLNRIAPEGVSIYAKVESFNPGGSVKDRLALAIILDAERRGVLKPGALACDMMYGPAAEGFLQWARAHGGVGRDGLGMLVEQAAEAFLFWRGVRPPSAGVLDELRREMAA